MKELTESNKWVDIWSKATLEERIELIMTYYKPALYKTANRTFIECYGGIFGSAHMNFEWAQDAVQDAMELAYQHLQKHPEHEVRHPKAWFRTLARNSAAAILRDFYTINGNPLTCDISSYAAARQNHDDYVNDTELLVAERARAQELNEAMSKVLTAEEERLLRAKFIDESRYEELATQTGKNINTLKSIIKRAKEKVQQELERKWQSERDSTQSQ